MRIINRLRAKGYDTHLAFVWVREVEFSIARVAHRVKLGGHNIPEVVIRRRFKAGLRNLFSVYRPLLASWQIYDNVLANALIAEELDGELHVIDQFRYQEILAHLEDKSDDFH